MFLKIPRLVLKIKKFKNVNSESLRLAYPKRKTRYLRVFFTGYAMVILTDSIVKILKIGMFKNNEKIRVFSSLSGAEKISCNRNRRLV